MNDTPKSMQEVLRELDETRARLAEAEEYLRAFRAGEVDAIIAPGPGGSEQVYTLKGADHTYRLLVEHMNQAAVVASESEALLFCNWKFERLLGLPSGKALALPLESFFATSCLQDFRQLLAGSRHGDVAAELTIRDAHGRLVPVYASLNRVALGEVSAFCLLLTDLTEQKRNEEIVAAGQLASAILEQMGEATVVCDPLGKILRASHVTDSLCRCDPAGRPFAEVFPLELEGAGPFDLLGLSPEGRISSAARYRSAAGEIVHVLLSAKRLVNEAGSHLGWVVTLADITAQKEVEQELRRAREAAESAARAKSDFLANMSHEIRTPMNAVIGFTDLLLATPLNAEQRRFLDLIKSSGGALLDVVNDVLDLSKMEAGKFDFVDEPFDLRELTEKVGRTLGLRAHQKGLELTSRVPFSVPTRLVGDPGRLRQVLVNLLGNAVKFTDRGEVSLSVSEVEPPAPRTNGDPLWLRFTVRDTGVGIPREKLQLLFQSFQQLDASSTRRQQGTGLGLFISRRIVEQRGGTIQADSEEGKGSTFTFTVPFRVQQGVVEAAVCEIQAPDLRGHKVLVVDDNSNNRLILLEMLANQEMEVSVAGSGEEALGLLRAANGARRPYELLLVDCQMPGIDGFQLIERVKADRRFPQPSILMITSDDVPAYCARARKVGAAGYLVKPVSCAELLAAVRAVVSRPDPEGEVPPPQGDLCASAVRGEQPLRVLLAEDNAVNQLLVRALIEGEGWSITVVEDGRAALTTLAREAFDVVLMDVQMPVLDGYEATRALRNVEQTAGMSRRIPVIGLTAHALREDRQRCLDAGMDEYLSKPMAPEALFEAIRRLVRRGGAERRGPPAELQPTIRDNPTLLEKLLETFFRDTPAQLAELREAVDRRSAGEIESISHRLLGTFQIFGARRSAEIARQLEGCGRDGRLEDTPILCERLEREFQPLVAFLGQFRTA